MKKITLSIIAAFTFASLAANPVDPQTARKAATNFLRYAAGQDNQHSLTDISSATPFNGLFIFSVDDDKGFVIVAGDNATEPIIAYSLSGNFDPNNIPPHVASWMHNYEKEIIFNRQYEPTKSVASQWYSLLNGSFNPTGKAAIEPMLTTTWNQSPYYNALCPYDSAGGGRAVCGCTATATAQIMKYFNHPTTGYGSCTHSHQLGNLFADYGNTTYLWDSMPNSLNANSSEVQVDAVATIIYHVGIAVSMDYKASGSGGKTASYGNGGEPSSENAFKYNFKYSPYVWTAFRIDYDLSDWKALMKNELNNGRPILYAGYDELQAGHAFVLDGYNNIGLFHINWGWGGSYDGYYKLNDLNPHENSYTTGYHFDLFATATIGIEPFDGFDENSVTVVTVDKEEIYGAQGSVTGEGSYNFGDTITLFASADNEFTRFVQWSDGCKYNPRRTVATGGNIAFTAQFAPARGDLFHYHTSDNAMNRASNVPAGLGADSVWGIKIPASGLQPHHNLTAVRFMGRYIGTHTLSIYTGDDAPTSLLYSSTFVDSIDYPFSWYTHTLENPVAIDATRPIWIVLKCTDVDTPGVFSIYGGNPYSLLVGDDMHPWNGQESWMQSVTPFSWMIEGLFEWDGTEGLAINTVSQETSLRIFPNPASDKVSIHTDGFANNAVVRIIDLSGHTCYSAPLGDSHSLSLSDFAQGVYFVIVSDQLRSSIGKLVVQ